MRLKTELLDFIGEVMKIMQEKFWISKYLYCFQDHLQIVFISYL